MSAVPPPPQATPHGHTLVIVSGMSGSGKSVALKTLEDLGFYCVDNLPAELLSHFAQSVSADETGTPAKLAVGIDVRNRRDLANIPDWLAAVGSLGFDPKLVFFDTREEVLLKRYAETRRRHPLSQLGLPLVDAIGLERQVLKPLRQLADAVVDTSDLNVHQLRRLVTTDFAAGHDNTILLMFESFAYRRGIPADADYVFDARILPNPHWDPSLRPLSGRDAGVRDYLEREPDVQLFVQQVSAFLDTWLPRIKQADSTRSYVTVAFGCTGGRHRSVYLAEQMARHARDQGWPDVAVHHRELD